MALIIVNILFLRKCNRIPKKSRSNYSFHCCTCCQCFSTVGRLGEENISLEYVMEKTFLSQFNLFSTSYASLIMDKVLLRLSEIGFK